MVQLDHVLAGNGGVRRRGGAVTRRLGPPAAASTPAASVAVAPSGRCRTESGHAAAHNPDKALTRPKCRQRCAAKEGVPGMIAADPVRSSWINAVSSVNGDVGKAMSSADELLARYGEPHRHYHTLAHIKTVLTDAELLAGELGLDVADREVLMLAVCAHDVVYDGHPGEDERASAVWARTRLADADVPGEVVSRVGNLILATTNHQADLEDRVADVLLDADLSILGASRGAYDAYTMAVRQEYSQVSDRLWRVGRAKVLSRLLDREHLYRTPAARRRWEAAARANIQRELAQLG